MTYHVMLGQKIRELVPHDGIATSVVDLKDQLMTDIDSISLNSHPLLHELSEIYSLVDSFKNEAVVTGITKIFKASGCTEEQAVSRLIKLEKSAKNRLSATVSNLRGTINETTMSVFYAEKNTPYGILNISGGYWELHSKEECEKRIQDKDRISHDKIVDRMLLRDPSNLLLKQIRDLSRLLAK